MTIYKINYQGRNVKALAELMDFPTRAKLEDIITICSLWVITADLYTEIRDNATDHILTELAGTVTGNDYHRSEVLIFHLQNIKSQSIAPYESCVEIFQNEKWVEWISLHSHQEIVQAINKVKENPTKYRIWNLKENAVVNLNTKN